MSCRCLSCELLVELTDTKIWSHIEAVTMSLFAVNYMHKERRFGVRELLRRCVVTELLRRTGVNVK